MALLDFLKKKEDKEKATKKVEKKTQTVSDTKKQAKPDVVKKEQEVKPTKEVKLFEGKDNSFSYAAISKPHISEKGTYLAEKNQYVFEVAPNFNKKELKRSVEGIYKVNVLSVNIIKIPAKKRRLGKVEGFRKSYKKAIVTIKEGQKIEVF